MNNLEFINSKEPIIRARTCTQCKEYIEINLQDPNNQKMVYLFEKKHMKHNFLITQDINDIKDEERNV